MDAARKQSVMPNGNLLAALLLGCACSAAGAGPIFSETQRGLLALDLYVDHLLQTRLPEEILKHEWKSGPSAEAGNSAPDVPGQLRVLSQRLGSNIFTMLQQATPGVPHIRLDSLEDLLAAEARPRR